MKRPLPLSAMRYSAWRAATPPIATGNATCCRRFTSLYGAASPASTAAFDRRSRRQDLGSIAAFSFIVVANAITMAIERITIERLGNLLTVLASLYVLSCYWRARDASPAALGATPSMELYRQKILRRQAMYGRFWNVVLVFVPGIILSTVGDAFASPWSPPRYAVAAGGFAALLVWAEWSNRREARRLEAELGRIEQ